MASSAGGVYLNPLFQVLTFAVGVPIGTLLQPPLQDFLNSEWALHPSRPPDVYALAGGVAQGQVDRGWAQQRANEQGFNDTAFGHLIDIANVGPGSAYAFELWRRNVIGEPGFRRALKRLGIEDEWIDDLVRIRNVLLTPAELAQARQRGFIDQTRQYDEAELQGVTNDRAEIQFKSAGLPPPTERALAMWRRGIITEAEFKETIVEGNEKLKYQDEEAALFHPLLTPATIVNQRLRGWRTTAWMNDRLAEHGYTPEQALDLFEGSGRPISVRQVFIGTRRGGVYDGPTGAIPQPVLKALQESNIRPEWYNLAEAQIESYPSAFVIRQLATSGALDPAQTHRVLMEIGWPVWLIDAVVTAWTGGTTTADGPLVKAARTNVLTRIRNAYIQRRADDSEAQGWLTRLNVPADVQGELLQVWQVARDVPGAGLTRAQVKKAFQNLPAEWPRDRALAELEDLGMEPAEAQTYLDE